MLSPKNFDELEIPWNSWRQNFSIFTVYKLRWFILFVVSLLNFTNGMISTQYVPLVNETNAYYCPDSRRDCSLDVILELVTIVGFILSAYPSVWVCSKLKIRYSLLLATFFLIISSILKIISSLKHFDQNFRYVMLILGHALCVPSQIIGLSIVPMISQLWFPIGQRTFSTGLGIYAFFLGYLTTFITSPWLHSIQILASFFNRTSIIVQSEKFMYLNVLPLILAAILFILAYFIPHSIPKKPPSASSGQQIFKQHKIFMYSPAFIAQIVIFGLAFGAFKFLSITYEDYLCLNGYVLDFHAYYALLILVGALAGVFLFSVLIDHFQDYKRTYRSCFGVMAGSVCLLGWAVLTPNETLFVLLSLGIFGIFGMATIFIGVEMAVETVYPMNQATASGLLFVSGYVFHLIFIGIKHSARRHLNFLDFKNQTCQQAQTSGEFLDYSNTPCIVGLVLIIGAILMLVCLHAKTRRRDYETNAKLMKISVFSMENPGFSTRTFPS